jgi:methionine-rich copper-binding protein CopC
MRFQRSIRVCLASLALLLVPVGAWAQAASQAARVVESIPAANTTIDSRTNAFSVRFDQPVDHVHSLLIIRRGGKVVETLHPRFKATPDVLFAQPPTLPPGEYMLQWQVKTLEGTEVAEGEIPFTIASPR